MNRGTWMLEVAKQLGYELGRMPHDLTRRCESLFLMETSVHDAVVQVLSNPHNLPTPKEI